MINLRKTMILLLLIFNKLSDMVANFEIIRSLDVRINLLPIRYSLFYRTKQFSSQKNLLRQKDFLDIKVFRIKKPFRLANNIYIK